MLIFHRATILAVVCLLNGSQTDGNSGANDSKVLEILKSEEQVPVKTVLDAIGKEPFVAFRRLLNHRDCDERAASRILLIISKTPEKCPDFQEDAVKLLKSGDSASRICAIRLLSNCKSDYAVPILTALLSDSSIQVSFSAIDGLVKVDSTKVVDLLEVWLASTKDTTVTQENSTAVKNLRKRAQAVISEFKKKQ